MSGERYDWEFDLLLCLIATALVCGFVALAFHSILAGLIGLAAIIAAIKFVVWLMSDQGTRLK